MVEFETDGHGTITWITSSVGDNVIIPSVIGTEKIKALANKCFSDYGLVCRTFASKTLKPLKIKKDSLNGISASGNIDLSNIDFSEMSLINIKLACDELILPNVSVSRPANIKIIANLVNLSSKFHFFEPPANSYKFRVFQDFKIGTLNVIDNTWCRLNLFHRRGEINKLIFSDNVTLIKNYEFQYFKIKNIVWGKNIAEIGEKAFFECQLSEFPPIDFNKTSVGSHAFSGENFNFANSLPEAVIDLTGLKTIPYGLFSDCRMKNVKIILSSDVQKILGKAFYLKAGNNVFISNLDCSKVTVAPDAFSEVNFDKVVLSESVGPMFHLAKINHLSFSLPSPPPSSISPFHEFKYHLLNCELDEIDFTNLELSKLKCYSCDFKNKLDLSKFVDTRIEPMFLSNCNFYSEVILPVVTKVISSKAFKNAQFKNQVIFSSCLDEIESDAFYNAVFSSKIGLPCSLQKISVRAFMGAHYINEGINVPVVLQHSQFPFGEIV